MDTQQAEQVLAALQVRRCVAFCDLKELPPKTRVRNVTESNGSFLLDCTGKTTSHRASLKVRVAGLTGQAMLAEKEQLHQQLLNEQAGTPQHPAIAQFLDVSFPCALGDSGQADAERRLQALREMGSA